MQFRLAAHLFAILVALTASNSAHAQCTKDIECKGDRICEKGLCVSPSQLSNRRPPLPPVQMTDIPRYDDYRVEHQNKKVHLRVPSTGDQLLDYKFTVNNPVESPVEANFGGHFYIMVASCGTHCPVYRLFDLNDSREYEFPFQGYQETKSGDSYTTFLEFKKDSILLRALYSVFLKSGGRECRQRFFVFKEHKLVPVTRTMRITDEACR